MHTTEWSYTAPDIFCSNTTTILVLVITSAKDTAGRKAVRETWDSERISSEVVVLFLLADPGDKLRRVVADESKVYGDVLQADFLDTYENLTMKSVMALHVASTFCREAKFMLKVDSDVFVNLAKLLPFVRSKATKSRNMFGLLKNNTKPIRVRSNKWFVLESEFSATRYPKYLIGGAYCMSMDVPPLLYAASQRTVPFRLEDIFITGILADDVGIPRTNVRGFLIRPKALNEKAFTNLLKYMPSYFVLHPVNHGQMRRVWNRMLSAADFKALYRLERDRHHTQLI